MKLIQINGCSCAGKSTIIRAILKQQEGWYYLSYDSFKRSFSDYKAETVTKYKGAVNSIVLAAADTVFSLWYPVVCDSSLHAKEREKIISKAREYNYDVIEINIEAEYPILEKRFHERVECARLVQNAKITNTSLERFKELYEIYNRERNPQAITYRSDVLTPDEIVTQITSFL